MSAYGEIKRASNVGPLPSTVWTPPFEDGVVDDDRTITIHHLTLAAARSLPGLLEYLGTVFAKEVEDGMTYPQEGEISQTTFEAYFFAADVFIGIVGQTARSPSENEAPLDIHGVILQRSWEEVVAGYYYIKPNYPGRSSHICNAGFVVPPINRGKGYGFLLAKSYLHYAPRLGYQASIFNLVYVNNLASVRLWDKLGFTKAGRIPRAGRLRKKNGEGEEYVDAWVIYKSFDNE